MAQRLVQTQTQKLAQQQRLSQQQMLQVRLLEMPLTELEESVNAELDDNPAMENGDADDALNDNREEQDEEREDESFDEKTEREERESALDEALGGIGRDDEMPQSSASYNDPNADYEEIVYGDITSFYDKLKEQMGEVNLTARQRDVMEYLIGSLDNDGLLRKDLDSICDELAIYHGLDVTQSGRRVAYLAVVRSCRHRCPEFARVLAVADRSPSGKYCPRFGTTRNCRVFRCLYQESLG